MKIFLTGGTGFIGSHLLNLLSKDKLNVTATFRDHVKTRVHIIGNNIKWINTSLDQIKINDLYGHDILIHLAAHTPNIPYDSEESCIYWNATVPINLIKSAHDAGINHVIVAGSSAEYGLSSNEFEYIPVNAPLKPIGSYPKSKAMASELINDLNKRISINISYLRIFQVYGEGEQDNRFWPSLKRAAIAGHDFPMSSGEQIRDFINVSDVALKFFEEIYNSTGSGKTIYKNIGTGKPTKLIDFANYWWDKWQATGNLLPGKIPLRDTDILRVVADISNY
jgi:nucleoside-diphosphate-sugar epimerase